MRLSAWVAFDSLPACTTEIYCVATQRTHQLATRHPDNPTARQPSNAATSQPGLQQPRTTAPLISTRFSCRCQAAEAQIVKSNKANKWCGKCAACSCSPSLFLFLYPFPFLTLHQTVLLSVAMWRLNKGYPSCTYLSLAIPLEMCACKRSVNYTI